jgi:hypothetical protein
VLRLQVMCRISRPGSHDGRLGPAPSSKESRPASTNRSVTGFRLDRRLRGTARAS